MTYSYDIKGYIFIISLLRRKKEQEIIESFHWENIETATNDGNKKEYMLNNNILLFGKGVSAVMRNLFKAQNKKKVNHVQHNFNYQSTIDAML